MTTSTPEPTPGSSSESGESKSFEQAGAKQDIGFIQEIVELLKHNKKYWMIPIFIILLLFGAILILGATSAAPFIYTLF